MTHATTFLLSLIDGGSVNGSDECHRVGRLLGARAASLSLSATTMLASRGLPCGPSVTEMKKVEEKGRQYGLKATVGRHGNTWLAFRINTGQMRKLFSGTAFLVSFLNHNSGL